MSGLLFATYIENKQALLEKYGGPIFKLAAMVHLLLNFLEQIFII